MTWGLCRVSGVLRDVFEFLTRSALLMNGFWF